MSRALANTLLSAAQEALSDEFIISMIQQRTKFENWLQVELAKRLRSSDEVATVELECTIENGQAIDLVCRLVDGSRVCIEIKLYVCGKAVSDTRQSITNDIQKLQQLSGGGFVLVAVYGYTEASKDRSNALLKVEEVLNPLNNFRESTQDVDLYLARVEGVEKRQ